ncbi:hypothetical protein JHK86_009594 [Glycine max]|nr:hypothetical protein JHK86_009594 [Glycine max]
MDCEIKARQRATLSTVVILPSVTVSREKRLCLEWWPFELIILLSGLLLNPQLETSVLSVCTRISNELGVGNPRGARVSVRAAMPFAVVETTIVSGTLFACRHVFGYIFSNEKEVVDSVTLMAPLVCIWVILDNIQGVLAGKLPSCLFTFYIEENYSLNLIYNSLA